MAQKGLKPFLGLNWVAHDYALHPIKFTNRGKENRLYNKQKNQKLRLRGKCEGNLEKENYENKL